MMLAGLLLAGTLPAMPVTVQAASFDCGKAATPVETAICGNPELSRRDEVLAKAYATALGGLSDDAKAVVQAGQRRWLDFAGLACTPDAKPFTAALSEDQQSCLVAVYRGRIEDLQQSRMLGDWRFYPSTSYEAVDDPDPEAFQGVATKEIASPRIDDPSETARTFNALLDQADAAASPDPKGEDYTTSDTMQTTTVVSVNGHRIALSTTSYWMGHGAAHGNYAISYTHYLTEQQRLMVASDLFAGNTWQEPLGQLALDELDRTIEGGIWPESRVDVPKAAGDPSRWNLTDDGLEIVFQPYEVTAYAAGAPTITIGWDKLGDYLAPGYGELLY